jgi:NAD(P)-dependent dehydrogenase (short-subunit alcohol dehydrogenase family)
VSFTAKVVAITGAAGGIGQALARHFGGEGAIIAALDISPAVVDFAAALGREGIRAQGFTLDIADDTAVATAFADAASAFCPIDILVNNAGFSGVPSLRVTNPENWKRVVDGNLNGAYNCAYAALPGMVERNSGAIINIGSVNGFSALGDPAYSAAKAGLVAFTQALAMEYGRYGIRANMVAPGTVRTPIWQERVDRNPEILTQLRKWYPLGRVVDPIDIARAVAFLASDAAAAITGAVLPVDCGLTAGNIVMSRELTLENF